MKYYKINTEVYKSLCGIKKQDYLNNCQMLLSPFRDELWEY